MLVGVTVLPISFFQYICQSPLHIELQFVQVVWNVRMLGLNM